MITEDKIYEEVTNHLKFSMEHGGFTIGGGYSQEGGCSCPICEYLRGYLIIKFYERNGYLPNTMRGM